jgi:hypothetical protein
VGEPQVHARKLNRAAPTRGQTATQVWQLGQQ